MRLAPTLPWANLAIRVRRPLDERLADLIDDLRRTGTRTSKVEIIEMLLWELEPESARVAQGPPRALSSTCAADDGGGLRAGVAAEGSGRGAPPGCGEHRGPDENDNGRGIQKMPRPL